MSPFCFYATAACLSQIDVSPPSYSMTKQRKGRNADHREMVS